MSELLKYCNKNLPTPPSMQTHLHIDEAELIKAMEIEDASPHFHSLDKGCKFETREETRGRRTIISLYCTVHKVEVCRCGWEWHWHYGSYLK